ncbi:MAG: NAD(P)H-dependent oxidoreductase, partial [Psychromonas sp.]
ACSHIILFAHNPKYTRENYAKVIDTDIANKRTPAENREQSFGAYAFVDLNTDENGNNEQWTKAQTYLALGNTLHVLARLGIDSTTMEGVDSELIGSIFEKELDGYVCDVALAIGYHHSEEDYNASLPKSRLAAEEVIQVL